MSGAAPCSQSRTADPVSGGLCLPTRGIPWVPPASTTITESAHKHICSGPTVSGFPCITGNLRIASASSSQWQMLILYPPLETTPIHYLSHIPKPGSGLQAPPGSSASPLAPFPPQAGICLPYVSDTNKRCLSNNWSHKRKPQGPTSKGWAPLAVRDTSNDNCPRSDLCKVFYSLFLLLLFYFLYTNGWGRECTGQNSSHLDSPGFTEVSPNARPVPGPFLRKAP